MDASGIEPVQDRKKNYVWFITNQPHLKVTVTNYSTIDSDKPVMCQDKQNLPSQHNKRKQKKKDYNL